MSSAQLTGVAPVLLVKDVVVAAAYYKAKLGFAVETLAGDPPNFAIVSRDKKANQPG